MRSSFCFFFLWVGFLTPPAFAASDWFPARLSVAGDDLIRNGKGSRSVLFVPVYQCALYLAARTGDAGRIIGADGPVSVRVEVLGDGVESMPDGWRRHLREEVTDRVFDKLQSIYRDLEKGDRVELGYVPGRGSWIDLNGKRMVGTDDRDLVRAVLTQWIGDDPVSPSLKHALLDIPDPDAYPSDD